MHLSTPIHCIHLRTKPTYLHFFPWANVLTHYFSNQNVEISFKLSLLQSIRFPRTCPRQMWCLNENHPSLRFFDDFSVFEIGNLVWYRSHSQVNKAATILLELPIIIISIVISGRRMTWDTDTVPLLHHLPPPSPLQVSQTKLISKGLPIKEATSYFFAFVSKYPN